MKTIIIFFLLSYLLIGCHSKTQKDLDLVSIQITDQNGLSEIISAQDKLSSYQEVDFTKNQPYKKVLRVYEKDLEGKKKSILTTYYPNRQIEQYLECISTQAYGNYKKWHSNGALQIKAFIIGGPADFSSLAQKQWLFDKTCEVYDEKGNCTARISYNKGLLEGQSTYYYPDKTLKEQRFYKQGNLEGIRKIFQKKGIVYTEESYKEGQKDGTCKGFFEGKKIAFQEEYKNNLLMKGVYFNEKGKVLSKIEKGEGKKALYNVFYLEKLITYKKGKEEGLIQIFSKEGDLIQSYFQKEGKKQGLELIYYPKEELAQLSDQIKLSIYWDDNTIHGSVKTYYPNGVQESQKEVSRNKKNGISFAWYNNGDLMLMEEYENDTLVKGTYYEKNISEPISKIQNGTGIATLYQEDGSFLRKIKYKKGMPVE
jgi:antitoxin component YwqK of YwqJK toxin-antitoxin module